MNENYNEIESELKLIEDVVDLKSKLATSIDAVLDNKDILTDNDLLVSSALIKSNADDLYDIDNPSVDLEDFHNGGYRGSIIMDLESIKSENDGVLDSVKKLFQSSSSKIDTILSTDVNKWIGINDGAIEGLSVVLKNKSNTVKPISELSNKPLGDRLLAIRGSGVTANELVEFSKQLIDIGNKPSKIDTKIEKYIEKEVKLIGGDYIKVISVSGDRIVYVVMTSMDGVVGFRKIDSIEIPSRMANVLKRNTLDVKDIRVDRAKELLDTAKKINGEMKTMSEKLREEIRTVRNNLSGDLVKARYESGPLFKMNKSTWTFFGIGAAAALIAGGVLLGKYTNVGKSLVTRASTGMAKLKEKYSKYIVGAGIGGLTGMSNKEYTKSSYAVAFVQNVNNDGITIAKDVELVPSDDKASLKLDIEELFAKIGNKPKPLYAVYGDICVYVGYHKEKDSKNRTREFLIHWNKNTRFDDVVKTAKLIGVTTELDENIVMSHSRGVYAYVQTASNDGYGLVARNGVLIEELDEQREYIDMIYDCFRLAEGKTRPTYLKDGDKHIFVNFHNQRDVAGRRREFLLTWTDNDSPKDISKTASLIGVTDEFNYNDITSGIMDTVFSKLSGFINEKIGGDNALVAAAATGVMSMMTGLIKASKNPRSFEELSARDKARVLEARIKFTGRFSKEIVLGLNGLTTELIAEAEDIINSLEDK